MTRTNLIITALLLISLILGSWIFFKLSSSSQTKIVQASSPGLPLDFNDDNQPSDDKNDTKSSEQKESFPGFLNEKLENKVIYLHIKLSKTPLTQKNRRTRLISRYNESSQEKNGFVIGLKTVALNIRPYLYWKGADQNGGWFGFADLKKEELDGAELLFVIQPGYGARLFISSKQRELRFLGGLDLSEIKYFDSPELPLSIFQKESGDAIYQIKIGYSENRSTKDILGMGGWDKLDLNEFIWNIK